MISWLFPSFLFFRFCLFKEQKGAEGQGKEAAERRCEVMQTCAGAVTPQAAPLVLGIARLGLLLLPLCLVQSGCLSSLGIHLPRICR